jgi:hypothetical protein
MDYLFSEICILNELKKTKESLMRIHEKNVLLGIVSASYCVWNKKKLLQNLPIISIHGIR